MTQEDLAGDTFSKSYISAVERSKMTPSIPALRILAERLGVTLAYLLGEEELDPQAAEAARQERQPGEDDFVQRMDKAERLLQKQDGAAALERLSSQEDAAAFGIAYQARWNWLYGRALLAQQRAQEASAALERGLEAARATQDRRAEGLLSLTGAVAAAARGEDAAAEQGFKQAIDLSQHINDDELLGSVRGEYGVFLAEQGRFQEAYEQMHLAHDASGRNH
jgi:transcriptional regulator with XRE-family HTH domain